MAFFVLIKNLFEKIKLGEKAGKVICYIGGCTFGIYLLEGPLRLFFYEPLFNVLQSHIKNFPACIISVFVIFAIALIIVSALKKIPVLKKII